MCVGVTLWFSTGGVVSGCRLNMFRMLIHPSSGACDLFVGLFMGCIALVRCVLVLRCGLAGVVWYPDGGSTCFRCLYIHPQEVATYLLSYFMGCIALVRCVLVLRCGLAGVLQAEAL